MTNSEKTYQDNLNNWTNRWKMVPMKWDPNINWPGKTNPFQQPSSLNGRILKNDPRAR